MIIGWFETGMGKYWKEVNEYLFFDDIPNNTLELLWDVLTYGLNYYPYDEIGEGEDKLRDVMKCMENDTDWDCEYCIKNTTTRNDWFKDVDGNEPSYKMEVV